jgi:hypothetical protein
MKLLEINFSLILYGNDYFEKFKNYTILSLQENIKNLGQKKKLIFYISTEKTLKKKITDLFEKKLKLHNYQLVYDYQLNKKKITYYEISQIQKYHFDQVKIKKNCYFIFLYSDIIYSNNTFNYCINTLKKNNKISAVGSFGLSININSKFKIFLKKILYDKNYLRYLINNSYNLISNFHKKNIYGKNINLRSNLIIMLKKNGLLIKSQHFHPIVMKADKLIKNKKIITLDSSLYDLFKSKKEIYIEKNMLKCAMFSFDSTNLLRNKITLFETKEFNRNKEILKKIFFLDLHYNLTQRCVFSENYIGFSFSKNLKITSLNRFINNILNKQIHSIKKSINEKIFYKTADLQKLNFKVFLNNYIIYLVKTKITFNNHTIRKILNYLFNIGQINKANLAIKKNLKITYTYNLLFMSYSFFNKLKFLVNLVLKKNYI